MVQATATLPPHRAAGGAGHITDHNLLADAALQLQNIINSGVQLVSGSTSAAAAWLTGSVAGDAYPRTRITGDGTLFFGDGTYNPATDYAGARFTIRMGSDNRDVCRFYCGNSGQALQFFDHLGNPIFTIPSFGGPSVFGDNFRVFPPGDVFNCVIKLRSDGTVQMAKGDAAGGVGVLAIGAVTTAPTGVPDGSHTLDGSTTAAGAVMWADSNGRVYTKRVSGRIDPTGAPGAFGSLPVAVGDWLIPGGAQISTLALLAGDANAKMFLVPVDVTSTTAVYNTVGAGTTIAGVGGSYQQFRFGLYQDDGTGVRPNMALQLVDFGLSSGFVNLNSTAGTVTAALSGTWSFSTAGRYWLAAAFQTGGSPTSYPTITTSLSQLISPSTSLATPGRAWYVTGVSGALPTSGTLNLTSTCPQIGLQRSA